MEQKAAEAAAAAAELEKQKTRIKFCSAGNLNPDDLRKEMNVERQRRSFIRDDDDAAYRVSPEEKVRRAVHARAHTRTNTPRTHAQANIHVRTRKHAHGIHKYTKAENRPSDPLTLATDAAMRCVRPGSRRHCWRSARRNC